MSFGIKSEIIKMHSSETCQNIQCNILPHHLHSEQRKYELRIYFSLYNVALSFENKPDSVLAQRRLVN